MSQLFQPQLFQPQLFADNLTAWFASQQRDLPWRDPEILADPYRILVSEVMLQQTTVAAVKPFFERFIARFPDVASLAAAPESEVLALWAGLGYYARARNLQKAARAVVQNHGGIFPRELGEILALPGVGRYTAGAVASIGFQTRAPIVDANVARVLSRVLPVEGDLKTSRAQEKLWDAATQIVSLESVAPREVNPAMMELGALVCTPKNPKCELCPVQKSCAAFAQGRQNELPQKGAAKTFTPLFDVCIWAQNAEGQILMRQRPDEKGVWWPLMWELPRTTQREGEDAFAALARLGQEIGAQFEPIEIAARVKHGVTRFSIELDCWRVEGAELSPHSSAKWLSPKEIETLPKPSSMEKLLQKLVTAPSPQLSLQL